MKILLSSLITLSLSLNTFAQDAVPLESGQKAPFTGILISNPTANELRSAVVERDGLKSINSSLNITVKLQDDIIARQNHQKTLLLDQNDKLALRLGEERSVGTWEKIGWFTLGVLATAAAGYSIGQIQTR